MQVFRDGSPLKAWKDDARSGRPFWALSSYRLQSPPAVQPAAKLLLQGPSPESSIAAAAPSPAPVRPSEPRWLRPAAADTKPPDTNADGGAPERHARAMGQHGGPPAIIKSAAAVARSLRKTPRDGSVMRGSITCVQSAYCRSAFVYMRTPTIVLRSPSSYYFPTLGSYAWRSMPCPSFYTTLTNKTQKCQSCIVPDSSLFISSNSRAWWE